MNLFLKIAISSLFMVLFFTGCGIKSTEYSASAENVHKLRTLSDNKIGIDRFYAKNPGEYSILCRLGEMVKTPNDESFEKYIENAFKQELIMSDMYDNNSKIKLSGYLEEVVASTIPGNAYWKFVLKVSSTNGEEFIVSTKRNYTTSILFYTACENMGKTLEPTVKQLISDVINHPKFLLLLN